MLGRAERHLGVSVSGLRGGLDACCSGVMDQCKVIALIDKCKVSQASEGRNFRDVVRRVLQGLVVAQMSTLIDLGIPFVEPPASLATWNLLS